MPSIRSQTLIVEECNGDPAQISTVNENPMTVSNADGNCIALGRAALGVEVRVFASTAGRNARVDGVVRCSSRLHLHRARMGSNIFSSGTQSLRNHFEGWTLRIQRYCDVKQHAWRSMSMLKFLGTGYTVLGLTTSTTLWLVRIRKDFYPGCCKINNSDRASYRSLHNST